MKLPKTQLTQVVKEEISSIQNVKALQDKFRDSMDQVDPNLDYKILAEVIANILVEEYGSHNFKPFISHLVARLK